MSTNNFTTKTENYIEVWANIPDYPGYQVSTHGRVKSFLQRETEGKVMKVQLSNSGYPYLKLKKGKESKALFIHIAVASAFIPNPRLKPEVNHKDGNKLNFHVSNLEWVTPTENSHHAIKHGLKFSGKVEVWKDIPGFPGYQASTHGRIKSFRKNRKEGRLLKTSTDPGGYPQLSLYKNQKQRTYRVHFLVAITFIPNPEEKLTVNHKDGIKSNNNVSNLEWATYQENIIHAYETGLNGK